MSDKQKHSPRDTHRLSLSTQHCLLALDLGTTTLAGRLLDSNGKLLAESRNANPQRPLGADILIRLQRAHEGAGEELQRLLVDGVRALVASLLKQAGRRPEDVAGAAAAGNPGICHLLCGFPVESLLYPPHRSPLTSLYVLSPETLGLGLSVPLQLFPAITGFVGGDLVAVLYGVSTHRSALIAQHSLVLDLGTNAEIALRAGEQWWVTSTAAGPTFEAGNIACGMPLAPGAVTDVHLLGDRLELTVSAGGRPAGLCGSGLLTLIAVARQGDLIDAGGRIVSPGEVGTNLTRYLVSDGEGWAIRFHRDASGELRLTQADVRAFQLAKGAVRAGVEVLLERSGLPPGKVAAVLVTGAFGAALPTEALRGVAMLPEGMIDRAFFVSNGVLDGLGVFLCDARGPDLLTDLLGTIKPLPLSGTPAFEKRFLGALEFKKQ